ncbi:permease [Paradesulfitobacterium ferrireducens]|uniref:permease n=1 Tax=Paradesulfitobacterium ferrireducens TaxID=2816476 RepID=UPI001A90C6BB|nr:permease [Paradesulfitobacterium ferrireducens]
MDQNILRPDVKSKQTVKQTQVHKAHPYLIPVLIFMAIFLVGAWYVKWYPYYHKALIAATEHSLGASIVSGQAATPPAPSWSAAWSYTITYFKSVWKAVILGLLLGSLVQVLLPQHWIQKVFGSSGFKSTALAGLAGMPSMMCTCCAAPVAVGLRERKASVGAALAYWLGNPVLNPATIIFMGFVLSWELALVRIFGGIILVFGVSYLANYLVNAQEKIKDMPPDMFVNMPGVMNEKFRSVEAASEEKGSLLMRWIRALWALILDTIPAYVIVVVLLGAIRAWLFPALDPEWANSMIAIIFFALGGTLFIIPTAAEIPIVQSLMSYGLGVGPGVALLMTLPAVSLPSLIMIKRVFPMKVILFVAGAVALLGILTGLSAMLIFA